MYIGIDIGGTTCRIAATLSLESPHNFKKRNFFLTKDFGFDFSLLEKMIEELSPNAIKAIGLGITGRLNKEKTMLDHATNLPYWVGQLLGEKLQEKFHCPVSIDNDVAAAGLGEYYFGIEEKNTFFYISWGTGLGGSNITPLPKPNSLKLDWHEFFQAWEKDCGGNEIESKYNKTASQLSEEEWEKVMDYFQKHLENFIEKTHAETIIFGGGISQKQPERLKKLFPLFPIALKISSLGEDTGLFGAFALIKNDLSSRT